MILHVALYARYIAHQRGQARSHTIAPPPKGLYARREAQDDAHTRTVPLAARQQEPRAPDPSRMYGICRQHQHAHHFDPTNGICARHTTRLHVLCTASKHANTRTRRPPEMLLCTSIINHVDEDLNLCKASVECLVGFGAASLRHEGYQTAAADLDEQRSPPHESQPAAAPVCKLRANRPVDMHCTAGRASMRMKRGVRAIPDGASTR